MLLTPVKFDIGTKLPEKQRNPATQCSHARNPKSVIYFADALIFANDFLTSKPACFFNLMTLNRSKSVKARLFSFWLRFLAHALSCHFPSIPAFSHCDLTTPVRAPRGSFSRTRGVRMSCARAIAWRGTAALVFVAGPSMRACIFVNTCAFHS